MSAPFQRVQRTVRLRKPERPHVAATDDDYAIYAAELDEFQRQQVSIRAAKAILQRRAPIRLFFAQIAQQRRSEQPNNAQKALRDNANVGAWTTSLDTVETSGTAVTLPLVVRRNETRRTQAMILYTHATFPAQSRKSSEVYQCGDVVWVAIGPDGPRTIRERCHHRTCLNCREFRGYQVSQATETLMESWNQAKFITLTRTPRDGTLRSIVRSLLLDFNRLRRTALWKACAGPGVYVIEITRHPSRSHFHVHLHCVVESKFIPQNALSEAWHTITGDSTNVWIERAKLSDARYIGKYLGKGMGDQVEDFERWAFWDELAGVRLAATFGGAPSLKSLEPPSENTLIAPLETVQRWAMSGDKWAQGLINTLYAKLTESTPPTSTTNGAHDAPSPTETLSHSP